MVWWDYNCPMCNFLMRSDNEEEIGMMGQQHSNRAHGLDEKRADIKKMAKPTPKEWLRK